jgi:hypothetical protein
MLLEDEHLYGTRLCDYGQRSLARVRFHPDVRIY